MPEESHTKEPFTSPGQPSNVNKCFCCGMFALPLAALGGLIDQLMQKTKRKPNNTT